MSVLQQANNADDKDFINFCSRANLIPDIENEAPYCPRCRHPMKIYYSHSYTDGARFSCTRCKINRSIRQGAWTKQSQLPLRTLAKILAYWCAGRTLEVAAEDLNDVSMDTVMSWYHEFSRLAADAYVEDLLANPLGPARIEIDESHFFKAKYLIGSQLALPALWVFGAIDSTTKRVLIEPVPRRDSETLLPLIQRAVAPGSLIVSDKWGAYNELSRLGYQHISVNHSENFVDPETGACTNRVEGMWGRIKSWFRKNSFRSRRTFEDHLREWGFRENLGRNFQACWDVVTKQIERLHRKSYGSISD